MGRRQCKSTFNNLKNNMVPPEPCSPTTGRPDHPNPEEIEENNLKNNFIKMIGTLKEMEENTNKKTARNKQISSRMSRKDNQTAKGNSSRLGN